MAGLAGRYRAQPGSHHGRARGVRSSPTGADRRHRRAQPAGTSHLRSAASGGRADDAGRPRRRIRRVARTRAADRGPRLREGAVSRERHDRPARTGRFGSRALIFALRDNERKAGGNAGFLLADRFANAVFPLKRGPLRRNKPPWADYLTSPLPRQRRQRAAFAVTGVLIVDPVVRVAPLEGHVVTRP